MKFSIRVLYLYLFSFVGLLIVVIGSISLVNLGFRTFIFPDADRYEISEPIPAKDSVIPQLSEQDQAARQEREMRRQKQRDLSQATASILVGLPLYLYHWKTIQKESAALSSKNS